MLEVLRERLFDDLRYTRICALADLLGRTHLKLSSVLYQLVDKGVSFQRNCGAASVRSENEGLVYRQS